MATKTMANETDAGAYVEEAMRGRLDDLRVLTRTAAGHGREFSNEELEAVGLEFDGLDPADDAAGRLYEYPLGVEATTTFEVVLGTGGPDDRLLFECDVVESRIIERGENVLQSVGYEVRRVYYRYSWSGSAELELHDTDREVAEALARRVVPELAG